VREWKIHGIRQGGVDVDMADGEAGSLIYKERVVRVSVSIISDGPARTI
jgi:hypothetical protein